MYWKPFLTTVRIKQLWSARSIYDYMGMISLNGDDPDESGWFQLT